MRSSELTMIALGLFPILAAAACATPLHDDGTSASSIDASAPLPIAKGCLPFHDVSGVTAISGSLHALQDSTGAAIAIVDDATASGNDVPSLAFTLSSTSIDDCIAGAAFKGGAPTSALSPSSLAPLASVNVAGQTSLYFSQPFTGIGVAAQDLTNGLFSSSGSLLFTADRPPYGTAAILSNDNVYAYGCAAARFLDGDCFVARVAATSIADESQYAYYTGGGQWSPRIDDAYAMTSGGTTLDVAFVPAKNLWLMLLIAPLGNTILARYGVAPEGPWSALMPLATCDLQDPDMFCAGIHAHPAIATPAGTLAVSYAVTSLSADAGARRAADPDAWWPRLAAVTLPNFP